MSAQNTVLHEILVSGQVYVFYKAHGAAGEISRCIDKIVARILGN